MRTLSASLKDIYPLIEQTLNEGGEVYMTIRGNSMAPFLKNGRDQAVFAPLGQRKIKKGDIVFYQRRGGQFVMHRVYKVDETGVMTLLGDAQWTLEPGICPEQLRAFVPRVVRNGKEISCEKGFWHRAMIAYQMRIRYPRAVRLAMRLLRAPVALKRRVFRAVK